MDVDIMGINQTFRWCPPGEFMMGSPEDEVGRWEDDQREKQHKVILTKGFWLAETACTQELWEGVMGENPSGFKGKDNPVETVSYKDCEKFLDKMKEKKCQSLG